MGQRPRVSRSQQRIKQDCGLDDSDDAKNDEQPKGSATLTGIVRHVGSSGIQECRALHAAPPPESNAMHRVHRMHDSIA